MSRTWFSQDLETVALFWRVLRRDGVTLGFTTHDGDLWFEGILHAASPGMVPSSIRKSAGFETDSAEVEGAITHDSISSADLAAGLFDGAGVQIGLVDWETLETRTLYTGTIGTIAQDDGGFHAELVSRKAELALDTVPRTSPTCRASFAGPGCNLNPRRFESEVILAALDEDSNAATFTGAPDGDLLIGGFVRWLDGPQAGIAMSVLADDGAGGLVLDTPLDAATPLGTRALVREGCDHTIQTCAERFANALNFRGEPYLPGNDLLVRYPSASS
ncbi:DUF2163 domain-containing protein [Novosphingobium sp. 1949]|uniref:DUF2163 domain-containing protein n=1 Tax=Novosphingobium organovorum TaxID=2930092 RepID=A0ABT0BI29_9SPHN|nr:DUF2163 domain-containing protein [Novosphingobium organovorum]MCJ2184716.1 DUF2163 domain-containing protein [Novosphingobium organovorum]